jgi:hypothetical protein
MRSASPTGAPSTSTSPALATRGLRASDHRIVNVYTRQYYWKSGWGEGMRTFPTAEGIQHSTVGGFAEPAPGVVTVRAYSSSGTSSTRISAEKDPNVGIVGRDWALWECEVTGEQ